MYFFVIIEKRPFGLKRRSDKKKSKSKKSDGKKKKLVVKLSPNVK